MTIETIKNETIKSAVQKQFQQVAANYTVSAVHARGVDLAELVTAAQLTGSERVLDAGCGTGHTALTLAPVAGEVIAVDLTEAMLAQGRRLAAERELTNVDFRLGDVEQLPFADGEFDLVVSRYSAHHWPHPQAALAEFRRVLRPQGRLILSDIVSFDDYALDTFVQTLELLRDPSHVRDHTVRQWLGYFAEAGFAAEVVYTWGLRLDFADWVARMATPPDHVAALRSLLAGAPADVRERLLVEADHSFTFPGALVHGQLP
jgi:ubiquinone/menaquinone biosynthesis C-methylase UbiE